MVLPEETLATGGAPTCKDCGVTPKLDVYSTPAGYYVGTYCNCGPYSRESDYFDKPEDARKALNSGAFSRDNDSEGKEVH